MTLTTQTTQTRSAKRAGGRIKTITEVVDTNVKRRTATTAAASGSTPTRTPLSPEVKYARHLATCLRDTMWHHRLGVLALDCLPRERSLRGEAMAALIAANPGCSRSMLYKTMKFASNYTMAHARELARAGIGWDLVTHLLALEVAERHAAERELHRAGAMTSRRMRLWKASTFGVRSQRGSRTVTPLAGQRPDVQARVLGGDCRSLLRRHTHTLTVFTRRLADGRVPTPAEAAQFRAAKVATAAVIAAVRQMDAMLQRIVATCPAESPPGAPGGGAVGARPRRGP